MFNLLKQKNLAETKLYNKILFLSRNKIFYTNFGLSDTFQNRIHLIFIHISFLNVKVKQIKSHGIYADFFQRAFELMFKKIEHNMREIGYGDVVVNKNMKSLVNTFYNILLKCENYKEKDLNFKNIFFFNYLEQIDKKKLSINPLLIKYFDKYEAFCLDLSPDSVLKGDLNFTYK